MTKDVLAEGPAQGSRVLPLPAKHFQLGGSSFCIDVHFTLCEGRAAHFGIAVCANPFLDGFLKFEQHERLYDHVHPLSV